MALDPGPTDAVDRPLLVLSEVANDVGPGKEGPVAFPGEFMAATVDPDYFLCARGHLVSAGNVELCLCYLSSVTTLPCSSRGGEGWVDTEACEVGGVIPDIHVVYFISFFGIFSYF